MLPISYTVTKIFMDNLHRNHLEVFDSRGKISRVLNIDGTINQAKTLQSIGGLRKK